MRSISPYERYGTPNPDADAALQVHVFVAGETLSLIADRYYGDWRQWRLIAARNSLTDVREIEPGTQLLIPRRPLEMGSYESS
ncbi:MAG TPA: LysM peptidoglycan-binding domain-containing protein [Pyrinomonadaceae bacterium]|jgi:nucleoid-associated protein YgaU|nr:LysM peptidoglycan-binding domain-containing protein [Pyrinomonadaceae bacterium]